jgi:hypothetical protein
LADYFSSAVTSSRTKSHTCLPNLENKIKIVYHYDNYIFLGK